MAVTPVERAKAELAAGRAWKARDRLLGAVAGYPADQAVLGMLGEVLFRLGDLPEAGRYWYLTARTGADVDAAIEALVERCGRSPEQLARSLPLVAPVDAYPAAVAARLDGLPEQAFRRRAEAPPEEWWSSASTAERVRDLAANVGAVTLLVVFLTVVVLGVLELVQLLTSAVSG